MAWNLVQSVKTTPVSPAATRTLPFAGNVTAGNRVMVYVGSASGGTALLPATPTDNQGNTYTQIASTQSGTDNPFVGVYTAVVGASGALTVTIGPGSLTGAASQIGASGHEFSGLSTATGTGCLDVSATNNSPGPNTIVGPTAATTGANQLALAILADWGSAPTTHTTASAGWTKVAGASVDANALGNLFVATKTSPSGALETATIDSTAASGGDVAVVAVIKLASTVAATALTATLLDVDTTAASPVSATALAAGLVDSDRAIAIFGTATALAASVIDRDGTTAAPVSAMVLSAAVVDSDTVTSTPTAGTGLTAILVDGDTATATLATAPGLVAIVSDGDSTTASPASAMALAATMVDGDTGTATLQTTASATSLTVSIVDTDTVTATLVSAVTLTAALADGDTVTVTLASAVTLTATLADGDTVTAGLSSAVLAFITTTDGDLLTAILTTGDRQFGLYNALRSVDDWTFAVGAWTGLPDNALPQASGRRVTWKLLGASDVTFTLDSELPEASQIHELISDLWIFWKTRPLFRGRIGSTSDTGDGATFTTTFNAADYRELLRRRELYEGDSFYYSNQDQALLGWNVISQTQARPGGNLSIVRGAGQATGVITSATYQAGKSIGEAVDQLSLVDNGFDYDFGVVLDANRRPTTGLTFDVYYPQRGVERRVVLDHPGAVASFTRGAVASDYANALRVTGDTALAAVRVEASDIATRPEGRWDAQFGDTSIMQSSTLAARAKAELALRQFTHASWTVTLEPEVWQGPDHIWLGDPVTLVVQRGRLNVVETLRVQEFTVALDDSSVPTISLTLGAPPPRAKWNLRRLDRRIQALERR